MNINEAKSALAGIEQDLQQGNFDDAFVLLTTVLHRAYIAGYQDATRLWAVWNDGEQFIGVNRAPLKPTLEAIEEGHFTMSERGTVLEW